MPERGGGSSCSSVEAPVMGGEREDDIARRRRGQLGTQDEPLPQRRFALARDKRRAMKSRVNREVQARSVRPRGEIPGAARQLPAVGRRSLFDRTELVASDAFARKKAIGGTRRRRKARG